MCEKCQKMNEWAKEMSFKAMERIGVKEGTKREDIKEEDAAVLSAAMLKAAIAVACSLGINPVALHNTFQQETMDAYNTTYGRGTLKAPEHEHKPSVGFLSDLTPKNKLEIN